MSWSISIFKYRKICTIINEKKGDTLMKKRSFYLTITLTFIACMIIGFLLLVPSSQHIKPGRYKEKREATAFFYRTMYALFEGTYNPEEGSVSPAFLERFEKHKPRLGSKCKLLIFDSYPDYYECYVFFPSGDIFDLVIDRRDGQEELKGFYQKNWDRLWKDELHMYGIIQDSDQEK
jgi:hypothetical protein